MDYIAVMFLSNLAHVTEEVRFVDGIEQPCLVIPTTTNQMSKVSSGRWEMRFIFKEQEANPKGVSHTMQLIYYSPEHTKEAKRKGIWNPTMRMGHIFPRIKGLAVDRTNHATNIDLNGIVVLSDIPKSRIKVNRDSKKRFVEGLVLRSKHNDNTIYTGTICVDDIPKDRIKTDPDTGKKYIMTRFKKMEKFDIYDNTHILMLVSDNGSELEIGRFREWVKNRDNPEQSIHPSNPYEIHNTCVNQRQTPESIDGLKF